MWWLYFRRSRKLVGVVIIEAPTLYDARTRVAVRGIGSAADYGDGKEIDEDVALVPLNGIGGLLWAKEAQQLSDRSCAAKANGPRVANYREEVEVSTGTSFLVIASAACFRQRKCRTSHCRVEAVGG
jgi:hypothetical protein